MMAKIGLIGDYDSSVSAHLQPLTIESCPLALAAGHMACSLCYTGTCKRIGLNKVTGLGKNRVMAARGNYHELPPA